jgi:hypothetical protein
VREPGKWGKHRTEVTEATEVTEGDGVGGKKVAVNVRASGAGTRRMGSGDASHPLSDTGTDTDTSFGRSLTLPVKKTGGTPRCSASHFSRVYFKLEGVSETEIGLNEVV